MRRFVLAIFLIAISNPSTAHASSGTPGKTPQPTPLAADILELNHVVNEQGTETLFQFVLWRFRVYRGQHSYFVVCWCMANKAFGPEKINGQWCAWMNGRKVQARIVLETWTLVDWEIADRKRLPEHERR